MHKANLWCELLFTPVLSIVYRDTAKPLASPSARNCKAEKLGKNALRRAVFRKWRGVEHAGFHSVRDQMRMGMTT